jgi:hypothetical protein
MNPIPHSLKNRINLNKKIIDLLLEEVHELFKYIVENRKGGPKPKYIEQYIMFSLLYPMVGVGYRVVGNYINAVYREDIHPNSYYKMFNNVLNAAYQKVLENNLEYNKVVIVDSTGIKLDKKFTHKAILEKSKPKMIKTVVYISDDYRLLYVDLAKYSKPDKSSLPDFISCEYFVADSGFFDKEKLIKYKKDYDVIPVVKQRNKKERDKTEKYLLFLLVSNLCIYIQRWKIERCFAMFKHLFGDRLKTKKWLRELIFKFLLALAVTDYKTRGKS